MGRDDQGAGGAAAGRRLHGARELIEHCRSGLAHSKCPTSLEIRDVLSRMATGKIQKLKLREPYWAGRERRVN